MRTMMKYLNICVTFLALTAVVQTDPETERKPPAGRGLHEPGQVNNGEDQANNAARDHEATKVNGYEEIEEQERIPTDDTIASVPESNAEDHSESLQPPNGDIHSQDGALTSDDSENASENEGWEMARPDMPSGQEKTSEETPTAHKIGAESTEPETPKTGDGATKTVSEAAPLEVPVHVQPETVPGEGSPQLSGVKEKETVETIHSQEVPSKVVSDKDGTEDVVPEELTTDQGEIKDEKEETKDEEKKAEEEPEAPKREQDLPSFDEWKEKIIAEQAEQAKQAKQGKVESLPASQQMNKKRINYASVTCGAKLLATNPEAKNAASVLNENKDQYMIQPCQAKKWFVVELCEPVAIQSLEIANLELFSSLPDSFIVYTSERYPSKEWKNLGTFRARDERAVQSFPIMEEEMFAKYIKVEPLTHYGDEHYCPLTLVRVYGTTVVEDYEEADGGEEEDPASQQLEDPDKLSNLFASATDTVISLVKTVLSPGEKEAKVNMEEIVKLNATTLNQSQTNTSQNAPVGGEQTAPCTPHTSSGEAELEGKPSTLVSPDLPHTPSTSVSPPIVTLIESRPHQLPSDLIRKCNFCSDPYQPSCYSDRGHLCGYYKATNFVLGTTCASVIGPRKLEDLDKLEKKANIAPKGKPEVVDTKRTGEKIRKPVDHGQKVPEVELNGNGVSSQTVTKSEVVSSHPSLEASVKITPSSTLSDIKVQDTRPDQSQETAITEPFEITPTKTEIHPAASCNPSESDCGTMGPDIVQIRPTTTDEAAAHTVTATPEMKPEDIPTKASETNTEHPEPTRIPLEKNGGWEGMLNETNGERVIYADSPGTRDSDYDIEMLAPPEDGEGEAIQKLSSGRRENAFMRLKNRIRALELNLTLSSRYLEELSKRYRREMEDMYLSLNKTILKLTNTSRTAEQRDLRQQANITELNKRIEHMTEQVEDLRDNLAHVHTQVIERHLFLMMVEFVLFLLIITWLLNRAHAPPPPVRLTVPSHTANPSHSLPPTQPQKPPDRQKKAGNKTHRRRNSVGATPPRPKLLVNVVQSRRSKDDIHLRLSGSEPGFGMDAVKTSSHTDFTEIIHKKRKKKKNKPTNVVPSQSANSISDNSNLRHSKSYTSAQHKDSVGLIFTPKKQTEKRDTSPTNSSCSSEDLANQSGKSSFGLGIHPKRPITARRSLDLRELKKNRSQSNVNVSLKNKCNVTGAVANGSSPVTDVGPLNRNGKSFNGSVPSPDDSAISSGWKTWILRTGK